MQPEILSFKLADFALPLQRGEAIGEISCAIEIERALASAQ